MPLEVGYTYPQGNSYLRTMHHSSTWNPYWAGFTGCLNEGCEITYKPSNMGWAMKWHCAKSSCVCYLFCVVCLWHTHRLPSQPSPALFLPGMLLSFLGKGVSGGGFHHHLPWLEASAEMLAPQKQLGLGICFFDFLLLNLPSDVIYRQVIREGWNWE